MPMQMSVCLRGDSSIKASFIVKDQICETFSDVRDAVSCLRDASRRKEKMDNKTVALNMFHKERY